MFFIHKFVTLPPISYQRPAKPNFLFIIYCNMQPPHSTHVTEGHEVRPGGKK
jgi:hypothetical protein